MKFSAILALALMASASVASAFPEGTFVCGHGDTTNEFTITKTTVASEMLPFMKVHIQRPELESKLSGVALLIEITDKKTGEIERRISLPGSNIDIAYTKDDEVAMVGFASKCHRK